MRRKPSDSIEPGERGSSTAPVALNFLPRQNHGPRARDKTQGLGAGVGRGRATGVARGVAVGVMDGVGLAVGVAVGVGVGVGVGATRLVP